MAAFAAGIKGFRKSDSESGVGRLDDCRGIPEEVIPALVERARPEVQVRANVAHALARLGTSRRAIQL